MDDSSRYKLLKLLHENPELSQRDLARHMGISLGKVNYCLQSLIKVGAVKAFSRSQTG
jgi:predicted transcriptional regulator